MAPSSAARRSPLALLGLTVVRLMEAALLLVIVGAICGFALYRVYSRDLPDPALLGTLRPFETTRIYARDGQTLLYQLFDAGQRTVVSLDTIPWGLRAATVAVEDANFASNPGVDLRGIVRALYLNRSGQVMSGGSTITQQLVRNVLFSPAERSEQSYRRKIREAILAFRLSREFSKEQILTLYLNQVYYGNMAYGVEAAAQSYFGKHAHDLSLAEAAVLAGLPQSPTDLNPFTNPGGAKARQKIVLDLMLKQGYLNREQADAALREPLTLRPSGVTIKYPHWVFYIRDLLEKQYGPELVSRGGLRVITTLDPAIQDIAEQATRDHIAALQAQHATNAGVIVIDPHTNEILAMVGSADYNNAAIDGQVNVTLADRQPGSSLKPLIYAQALENGWTPATIIWDTPTDFNGYKPQNYDNTFHGPQRLRMALAGSLNIPAVKTLSFVGLDTFLNLAHRMGITTLQDRARYGLAVALGAGEVKLLDLTTAYTALANGGMARPTIPLQRVTTSHGEVLFSATPVSGTQVLGPHGPDVAYQITNILSDNAARTPIFGPHSVLHLPDDRPAAVKTGTSDDYRNSWAIGWTPDLVVGAWVGNSDNTPMQKVAGSNGAGTIWNTIMQQTHIGKPLQPFKPPPGLEDATICPMTGLPDPGCANPVVEHFIRGTVPKADSGQYVTVTVGGDGSCLATDATPLTERQRRTFLLPPNDAHGWVPSSHIPQPPTVACAPPAAASATGEPTSIVAAAITTPRSGDTIGGTLIIQGNAQGPYELDYGSGASPATWTTIVSGIGGVANGLLGQWNTDALPRGSYTLRLQVTLPGSPQQEVRVAVVVDHDKTTLRLLQPLPDQVIKQTTVVTLQAALTGPASHIEFLVDDQLVGTAATGEQSVLWTAVAPGRHTVVAVAVTADNGRISSPPVVIRVE